MVQALQNAIVYGSADAAAGAIEERGAQRRGQAQNPPHGVNSPLKRAAGGGGGGGGATERDAPGDGTPKLSRPSDAPLPALLFVPAVFDRRRVVLRAGLTTTGGREATDDVPAGFAAARDCWALCVAAGFAGAGSSCS